MIHEMDYTRITELKRKARRRVGFQVTWYRLLAWWAKPIVIVGAVIIGGTLCGWIAARCCR
jgi:hypothetical protein